MVEITNFTLSCTKSLDGRVVIAFRSNLPCFCEIWAVTGSIPPSGTWFFFFVQINYSNVFMYADILDNDKQDSKCLGNLLKITINFWTLWYNCLCGKNHKGLILCKIINLCILKRSIICLAVHKWLIWLLRNNFWFDDACFSCRSAIRIHTG